MCTLPSGIPSPAPNPSAVTNRTVAVWSLRTGWSWRHVGRHHIMAIKLQNKICMRRGFTLVEMLAVLVIMGILIIFAIPAVERLLKSGGLSAAAREVSNTLGLARQYAVTHRTNARVIFAFNNNSNPGTTALSSNLWYIAYTVVVSDPTNSAWDYTGKWDFLPGGSIFLSTNAANTTAPARFRQGRFLRE